MNIYDEDLKYFFCKNTQSFYVSNINEIIPAEAIQITEKKYNELLVALNNDCIIFDDLSYSDSKPTAFHKWNGEKWIEDIESKKTYITNKNEELKNSLLNEVNQNIQMIKRLVKYNFATDDEKERLESLEIYSIQLSRLDTSIEDMEIPTKP